MLDIFNALVSFQPMVAPIIDQLVMPLIQLHGMVGSAMGPGTIAADEFARLRSEAVKIGAGAAVKVGKAAGRKAKALGGKVKSLAVRLRSRGYGPVPPAAPVATAAPAPGPKHESHHSRLALAYSLHGKARKAVAR